MKDPGVGRDIVRDVLREVVNVVRRGGHPGPRAEALGPLPSGSTFIRGLSVGALVGAAIAGSAIWERRHRRRAGHDAATAPGGDVGDAAGS